jgi:hypothetical protein
MSHGNQLSRRGFIQVAGTGVLAAGDASVPQNARAAEAVSMAGQFDVIVCGGGTSGLPAAIAAAQRGAEVAIIERYGFLGGNAAFSIMPCWHGLREHHSGLLTHFAQRVEAFGVGPVPLRDNHIEPEVVKILFLELALEHNIQLYLHHFIVGVVKQDDRVSTVITESKSGRRAFNAKVFIDATGDGDIGYHAGAQYLKGEDGEVQAMSLRFRVGYVDLQKFAAWGAQQTELNAPGLVGAFAHDAQPRRGIYFGSRLDRLYDQYRDKYEDLPSNTYFNCSSIRRGEISINTTRAYDLDGTNADDLTRGEIITRKQAWAVWRFLKENVPGFEESVIVETAPQVGVRQTRCIVGDHVLTTDEGNAGKTFADSVQTCRVVFDSHDKKVRDWRQPRPVRCPLSVLPGQGIGRPAGRRPHRLGRSSDELRFPTDGKRLPVWRGRRHRGGSCHQPRRDPAGLAGRSASGRTAQERSQDQPGGSQAVTLRTKHLCPCSATPALSRIAVATHCGSGDTAP